MRNKGKPTRENSLANLNPTLSKEWHPTMNGKLTPFAVASKTHRKAWWICVKGHEWEASISSRSGGNGCPYCSNRRVTIENCLATLYPDLAKEWHSTKNGDLTPNDVLSKTHRKAWWICNKGHEWEAKISNRSALGRGCPYCSNTIVTIENCLATLNAELAKEWHPSKNGDLTPFEVNVKTGRKVWWQCKNGHEWEAKISNRSNGNDCPYCKGRKVCDDNSLRTLNPLLAKEWHPIKNRDLKADQVTISSNKKVWWQCKNGHEWAASINSRNSGNGCPNCNISSSYPESFLLFCLRQVFPDVKHRYKIHNIYEIDIYLPSMSLAIEYDGVYWHTKKKKRDIEKNKYLYENNVKLIRIREKGLDFITDYDAYNIQISDTPSNEQLSSVFTKIISIIKEIDSENYSGNSIDYINFDIETKVRESISLRQIENSLVKKFPHVAGEWHPSKNGILKPENFQPQSSIRVWWKCEKGHDWNAVISARTRNDGLEGTNCPYCYGRYATPENSLAVLRPDVAKQWHASKNGELTPNDVKLKSEKLVWWMCKEGHEWKELVRQRVVRKGCPYCTGRYVTKDNCLATLYPDLAREWHSIKNGNLTPYDVKPGSNKKIWWQCGSGHEWETMVSTRTRGNGCRVCGAKRRYSNLFKNKDKNKIPENDR
ncbi:zinc-ribbon domain-containing protein [Bacillus sp. FJAT-29937]|uniref:zinc-ribbon domain-containing protein n=1 Tax=Bacillus sp. FJAT-29937 TaxID=1720553 RepID=UPI00082B9CCE|nr:zinc-ribbon domain-containing protein [Bacillus sp. FJAT-29937]